MEFEEIMENISNKTKNFILENKKSMTRDSAVVFGGSSQLRRCVLNLNKDYLLSTIYKLSKYLGISISELIGEVNESGKKIESSQESIKNPITDTDMGLIERIENLEMQLQTIINFINKD